VTIYSLTLFRPERYYKIIISLYLQGINLEKCVKDSLIESTITPIHTNFVDVGHGTGNSLTVSQMILLAISAT